MICIKDANIPGKGLSGINGFLPPAQIQEEQFFPFPKYSIPNS